MAYPCVDLNTRSYGRCIGLAECAATGQERCWTGHRLVGGSEVVQIEVRVESYTPADCASCANVTQVPEAHRNFKTAKGDGRLMLCSAGYWTGLCSVYNLTHHKIPLKEEGYPPCPGYKPAEQLSPEWALLRQKDAERSRTRRQLLREARARAESMPQTKVL